MQKILRLLEGNVEWIALLLAVAYLGWTIWSFLVVDPVSRPLDGQTVNPANVDEFIDAHAAEALRQKMRPDQTVPSFTVQDFGQNLGKWINLEPENPQQLASADFDFAPFDTNVLSEPGAHALGIPVEQLPKPPAPQPLMVAAALDTIAPPNAAGGNPPANGKDVRLVLAGFTIPWSDIYDQWNKAFGPPKSGQQPRLSPAEFEVVAVSAERMEKVGDNWIADNANLQILNGADLPAYPTPGNKQEVSAYRQALNKNPTTVVAPAIPTVIAGAAWKDPLQYMPGGSNQPATPPVQSGAGNSNQYWRTANTAEPRGTLYAQFGGPPGFGGGPPGYGGGGFRPPTPEQQTPAQPPPPTAIPPADGTVDPKVVYVNPNAVLNPAPQTALKQNNVIQMAAKSPDLFMYIIDTSAQPGKTYRYRISYKAFNPIYNKPPQAVVPAHKAWTDQFDLASGWSDYSPEIQVPQQTYCYCGTPQGHTSTNPFDVFTWSDGKWQKETFNVDIGDPIGSTDSSVDYGTGYTFAEKRNGRNNRMLVYLVDQEGNVIQAEDSDSSDYKRNSQWMDQQKNGTNATPTPTPGGPPGFGGAPPGGPPPGFGGPPPGYGPPGGGP
jgi:hypothetical protein